MIFDAHAHIFPDKVADRAAKSIGDFYSIPCQMDGKLSTLISLGGEAGITRFLVHSVAISPHRARNINQFIARCVSEHPDALTGFAALHPDCEDIDAEIRFALDNGLKGFKFHPDMQLFALDEPRSIAMFKRLEGVLPVLIHTGDTRYSYSSPAQMRRVLDACPRLTAICAHLGGWSEWTDACAYLADTNCYVDTSSSLYAISPEDALRVIRLYGAERVLFGTDFPMWDPMREVERLRGLQLTDSELDMIFYKNAERLFL